MKTVVAVLFGGAIGSALRLTVDLAFPHTADGFPVATLVINVAGSFVLALLVARVWPAATPPLRAGLGPGLLGSFTTFSAVALSAVQLTTLGGGPLAIGYIAASLAGGLAAAALGIRLGSARNAAS